MCANITKANDDSIGQNLVMLTNRVNETRHEKKREKKTSTAGQHKWSLCIKMCRSRNMKCASKAHLLSIIWLQRMHTFFFNFFFFTYAKPIRHFFLLRVLWWCLIVCTVIKMCCYFWAWCIMSSLAGCKEYMWTNFCRTSDIDGLQTLWKCHTKEKWLSIFLHWDFFAPLSLSGLFVYNVALEKHFRGVISRRAKMIIIIFAGKKKEKSREMYAISRNVLSTLLNFRYKCYYIVKCRKGQKA